MNNDEFKKAFSDSASIRFEKYADFTEEHTFSFLYKIRKRSIIRKSEKLNTITYKYIPQMKLRIIFAIVILSMLALTGAVLFFSINGFSFKKNPTNSVVFVGNAETAKHTIEELYRLDDSCGYELISSDYSDSFYYAEYLNGDKKITLTQQIVDTDWTIDTEDANIEEISIDGYDGFCLSEKGEIYLAWIMDGYVFGISGNINKTEAMNLAKMTVSK